MSDIGDDFRAVREHQRQVKSDRVDKFNKAYGFIREDASKLGITVRRGGNSGQWFFDTEDHRVEWWPGSGKTSTGDYFRGPRSKPTSSNWYEMKPEPTEE